MVDQKDRCVGFLSAVDLLTLTRDLSSVIGDLDRVSDVSREWLVEQVEKHDFGRQPVSARMTEALAAIDPDTPLPVAASEMLRHRVHHLPVLDGNRRLLGIISTLDLLEASLPT